MAPASRQHNMTKRCGEAMRWPCHREESRDDHFDYQAHAHGCLNDACHVERHADDDTLHTQKRLGLDSGCFEPSANLPAWSILICKLARLPQTAALLYDRMAYGRNAHAQ